MRSKILLINPDEAEISQLQHLLETEGHKVKKVYSGEAARRVCEDDTYDLVLVSSTLKDTNVGELIHKLRQPCPETEFIIITNLAQFQNLSGVSHYDVAGYLIPPITEDKVREVSQRAIRQHELLRENRRLIDAITQAKKEWEATVDAIEDPIFIVDADHKIVRANLALFRMLNKGVSQVIGQKCSILLHMSDAAPSDCVMETVKREAGPITSDLTCRGLGDGKYICAAYPQIFVGGFGTVHVLRDARKVIGDDRYRQTFEKNPVPSLLLEYDTRKIIDANAKARNLLGYKKDELINVAFDHFLTSEDRDSIIMAMPKNFNGMIHEVKAQVLNRENLKLQVRLSFGIVEFDKKMVLQVVIIP